MTAKDRTPAERIPIVRKGDPITARLFNRVGQGVNEALAAINPPRGLRSRSTDEQINELVQPESSGVDIASYEEVQRTTSTVRVYQDDDPMSENWVDIERVETIEFKRSTGDCLILIFDNE